MSLLSIKNGAAVEAIPAAILEVSPLEVVDAVAVNAASSAGLGVTALLTVSACALDPGMEAAEAGAAS